MTRPLRIEFSGAFYHVTSRGNERKDVFRADHDRRVFLDLLGRCCVRFHWLCHAYCLMDNHYHLILETSDIALSRGMRHLNGVYTQKFNWNHKTVGHLFQGRYKAVLIEKETHLLEACRYVVLNPVRAKMVPAPGEWEWSSYRGTCGDVNQANYLTTEWILQQFAETHKVAIKRYRQFVKDGIDAPSIWEDLRCQTLLGDEGFVHQFSEAVKGVENVFEIPKAQRHLSVPSLDQIFTNNPKLSKRERNELIREAVVKHGYTEKAVADFLQLHYSRISRILAEREKTIT